MRSARARSSGCATSSSARPRGCSSELRGREGDALDAVGEVAQRYVFQVLPDILGLPEEGREHMHGFSEMVWATMGPPGELFDQAMQRRLFGGDRLARDARATALGARPRRDRRDDSTALPTPARSPSPRPSCCCRRCFQRRRRHHLHHHGQRPARLGAVPRRVSRAARRPKKSAPRSTNRCAGIRPSRMAGRIAMRDVEIDDYVIPGRDSCGLMFAAANRDPRFWDAPDDYRLDRDNKHSLGWGYGVHGCVGRTLATMEARRCSARSLRQVEGIELAGEYEPWMTTVGHGPAKPASATEVRLRRSADVTATVTRDRCDPLRAARAHGGENFIAGDDHDHRHAARLFRLGDPSRRPGRQCRRHRLRGRSGGQSRANADPARRSGPPRGGSRP